MDTTLGSLFVSTAIYIVAQLTVFPNVFYDSSLVLDVDFVYKILLVFFLEESLRRTGLKGELSYFG